MSASDQAALRAENERLQKDNDKLRDELENLEEQYVAAIDEGEE